MSNYITVKVHDIEDNFIADIRMRHTPRVDEIIWITDWQDLDKCSSYKVREVCYWVSTKIEYFEPILYVEPTKLTKP